MLSNIQDYLNILPFIIIGTGIFFAIIIEISLKESEGILSWFSFLIFLSSGLYSIIAVKNTGLLFNNMLAVGGIPAIFNFIFSMGAALVVLSSQGYLKKFGSYYGEYYILVLSSVLGMMLMAGARDLFIVFIGLEQMSICFYILAGINRAKQSANEASLKYFLLGSFATGFVVYGIALIYGSTSTTSLIIIINNISNFSGNPLFILGMLLLVIGFSFKIAAFPFHMWVPDVYQGSATTITGLMSTGGKAAAFSVLLILIALIYPSNINIFRPVLAILSMLSMVYGSIVAISQSNIKRMLAYSSIAHAGYMTIGLAAGNEASIASIVYYLTAYTFMNMGAFGIVALVEGESDSNLDLNYYAGLNNRNPLLAALMSLFMFALAGLPPFAGFFGKYYIFISAVEAHLTWLAIIGVLTSAIGVYFYIRLVVLMYFSEAELAVPVTNSKTGIISVVISAIIVILLGLFPGSYISLISAYIK